MSQDNRFVGIDLGTTNSAAAVFDGNAITQIRTSAGGILTPSIVRVSAKGQVTVGERARKFLETDPENTKTGFKRLMGTQEQLSFPASEASKAPEALGAEILKSLRADIKEQLGFEPERAVISVPALFELPQNAATSEAARLAGFQRVELLQEPIASALAAGWSADSSGTWLVYDLGGGTFDASLLETRDGLLRIIGHDGDNFLGGRDFDARIVDWAIETLARDEDLTIERSNPEHQEALYALRVGAEEAKIELTRNTQAVLSPPPFQVGDRRVTAELELDRETMEGLIQPVIDRSIEVCERLLKSHGVQPQDLGKVVLVGGPTVMPALRKKVQESLQSELGEGLDPMTLVSQGAALYAATANLGAKEETPEAAPNEDPTTEGDGPAQRVWLQYPAMSSDLLPHVVGRVVEGEKPNQLKLKRGDGKWASPTVKVDDDGGFVASVELLPRQPNVFHLEAKKADGTIVPLKPANFTIVQGLTISDPPLSRSIGIALANNAVQVYFERGTPLPARRTFTHNTVESVVRGSTECVLRVPIIQGEFDSAHLCRLIGTLEITGEALKSTLPAGSPIELTIELDRGGRMAARALVPAADQVFEEVADLLVPEATPEVLERSLAELKQRVVDLRTDSFRTGATVLLGQINPVHRGLEDVERDIEAARGGDADSAQKARRNLIELDAQLEAVEVQKRWPEMEEDARERIAWASRWISEFGTPPEQQLFEELQSSVTEAREARDPLDLQRHLRLVRQLGSTAFYRHPDAWEWMFQSAASEVDRATDLPKAQLLVQRGRAALERRDTQELRGIVKDLWRLLPADAESRKLSFDSGVR